LAISNYFVKTDINVKIKIVLGALMGRWVSVYFNEKEWTLFRRVLEKESRRRGRRLSPYELLKEWALKLIKEAGGEDNPKAN